MEAVNIQYNISSPNSWNIFDNCFRFCLVPLWFQINSLWLICFFTSQYQLPKMDVNLLLVAIENIHPKFCRCENPYLAHYEANNFLIYVPRFHETINTSLPYCNINKIYTSNKFHMVHPRITHYHLFFFPFRRFPSVECRTLSYFAIFFDKWKELSYIFTLTRWVGRLIRLG